MSKPVKIVMLVIALGLIAWPAKVVLWDRSPVPEVSSFEFDLERIRELATQHPGPMPTSLNCLRIAQQTFPIGRVVAGENGYDQVLVHHSFQVVFPGSTRGPVVIEAVHSKDFHERFFPGQPWSQERWDEMQSGMREASLIVATHEHYDHVEGIASSPYLEEILDRVLLTRDQIEGFTMRFSGFPSGVLQRLVPLEYDTYHSPAPGVVLIEASGHSRGHQFVYIQLTSGTEFIYVGDTVWSGLNIDKLTGRPLLVSLLIQEDRSGAANHIRMLFDRRSDASFPLILVAHDGEQIIRYQERGLLGKGFE